MCLLILQKDKTKMKKASFYEAHKNNKDGIGLLIRKPNKEIKIYKFMNVDLAWKHYEDLQDSDYNLVAIHFRMATSGGVNYEMIHPFPLGAKNGGRLLHNGIIGKETLLYKEGMSDTASLAEHIKEANLTEKQLYSYPIKWFLTKLSGSYNKFLVVSPNGYKIYNENIGHWKDGIWYSNSTYKILNASFMEIEEEDKKIKNWLYFKQ